MEGKMTNKNVMNRKINYHTNCAFLYFDNNMYNTILTSIQLFADFKYD